MTVGESRFRAFIAKIKNAKTDKEICQAGIDLVEEYRGFHYNHIAVATQTNMDKCFDSAGNLVPPGELIYTRIPPDTVNDGDYVLLESPLNGGQIFVCAYGEGLVDLGRAEYTYPCSVLHGLKAYIIPRDKVKKYLAKYLVVR